MMGNAKTKKEKKEKEKKEKRTVIKIHIFF